MHTRFEAYKLIALGEVYLFPFLKFDPTEDLDKYLKEEIKNLILKNLLPQDEKIGDVTEILFTAFKEHALSLEKEAKKMIQDAYSLSNFT